MFNTGGDWSDVTVSQGMPRTDSCHQELGRGMEEFYTWRKHGLADILTSDFGLQDCVP